VGPAGDSAAREASRERLVEPWVSSLELFFDLVFVFALTQVTAFIASDPTWSGLGRGVTVLASMWWAWVCYS
jgi:low temperature requirement protein LtrA